MIGADFYLSPKGLEDAADILVKKHPFHVRVKPSYAHYQVSYRKYNKRWMINNVHSEVHMQLWNRKKKHFSDFSTESEFIVTRRQTEDIDKFDRREVAQATDVFVNQIEGYDKEFWGSYNIIQPDRSLQEAYRQLNIDKSIYLINH